LPLLEPGEEDFSNLFDRGAGDFQSLKVRGVRDFPFFAKSPVLCGLFIWIWGIRQDRRKPRIYDFGGSPPFDGSATFVIGHSGRDPALVDVEFCGAVNLESFLTTGGLDAVEAVIAPGLALDPGHNSSAYSLEGIMHHCLKGRIKVLGEAYLFGDFFELGASLVTDVGRGRRVRIRSPRSTGLFNKL